MKKRLLGTLLSMVLAISALAGCGSAEKQGDSDTGSVYYMNFKPEVAEVWEEIAEVYEQETGVKVKVRAQPPGAEGRCGLRVGRFAVLWRGRQVQGHDGPHLGQAEDSYSAHA